MPQKVHLPSRLGVHQKACYNYEEYPLRSCRNHRTLVRVHIKNHGEALSRV